MKLAPDKSYTLEVLDGLDPGRVFRISKPQVSLGRKKCDIHLQDPEISRHHANLTIDGEVAVLEDLDSANGTYIEGIRIQKGNLVDGSHFRMGTHQLVFRVTNRKD
jgi:pSer/pThr/pTyr-binding forkhead associated (FHA) protein